MRLRRKHERGHEQVTIKPAAWADLGAVPGKPAVIRAERAGDLVEHRQVVAA